MQIAGNITGNPIFKQRSPSFVWGRYPRLVQDSGGYAWKDLSLRGVTPSRLLIGQNAIGSTWTDTAGNDDLTLQAGSPAYNVKGHGPDIAGVTGDGTAWFQGSSGPATGTNDIIIAVALRLESSLAGTHYYASTYSSSEGFRLFNAAGTLYWQLWEGGSSPNVSITPTGAEDLILVGCVNVDEGSTNGGFLFSNGIASSGADFSAVGTISDDGPLTLLADEAGGNISTSTIYAAGLWLGSSLFSSGATGATEMQAVANELTQRFLGIYPQKASSGDELLTTTRATDDGLVIESGSVNRVFYIGNGGVAIDDTGLLIQGAATNLVDYSYDITNWDTLNNMTAALDAIGPDQITNGTTTVTESSDGGEVYHYVEHSAGTPAAGLYEFCFVLKSLTTDRDWGRITVRNGAWSNYTFTYFDYKNRTVGTTTDGGTMSATGAIVEDWGNGWSACRLFVDIVTSEALLIQFMTENLADQGDLLYVGDGRDVCEIAAVQICLGKYRHSIIRGNAGQATRNALNIDIDADNIPSGDFTITGEFKLPTITSPAKTVLFNLGDGTVNNRIELGTVATDGHLYATTIVGGSDTTVTLTGAGSVFDDAWHKFLLAYEGGVKTVLKIDNTEGTDSHGVTLPARSSFELGRDVSDANHLNGKIRNIQIYNVYDEQL